MSARLTFVDAQGREWLVRDVVIERRGIEEKRVIIPIQLGDSYAQWRVFDCREPRERRVYRFVKGQNHAVTDPTLAKQFREAQAISMKSTKVNADG